jgi:hypothetical protein
MKTGFMYSYQANNGEVEVYSIVEDGFEWICNCGKADHEKSWENAVLICTALNIYMNK